MIPSALQAYFPAISDVNRHRRMFSAVEARRLDTHASGYTNPEAKLHEPEALITLFDIMN